MKTVNSFCGVKFSIWAGVAETCGRTNYSILRSRRHPGLRSGVAFCYCRLRLWSQSYFHFLRFSETDALEIVLLMGDG